AIVEAPRDQFLEMVFVAHPVAVRDAGAARDGDDIGTAGGRRLLLAGDLVDAVVHNDDGQVARFHHSDGSKAAERPADPALALQRDHAALWLGERDAEGDGTREAHAPD